MTARKGSVKEKRRLLAAVADTVEEWSAQLSSVTELEGSVVGEVEIVEHYETERAGAAGIGGDVRGPLYAGLLGGVAVEVEKGWHSTGRGTITVRLSTTRRKR